MKVIQKGFSLIELMIVVAIVGILAVVAIPSYQEYKLKTKFDEALIAIVPHKAAIEACVQDRSCIEADVISGIEAGGRSIPALPVAEVNLIETISLAGDGTLSLKTTQEIEGLTYIVKPEVVQAAEDGGLTVNWIIDPASTCLEKKVCKQL